VNLGQELLWVVVHLVTGGMNDRIALAGDVVAPGEVVVPVDL
jgi:hypothetical protein